MWVCGCGVAWVSDRMIVWMCVWLCGVAVVRLSRDVVMCCCGCVDLQCGGCVSVLLCEHVLIRYRCYVVVRFSSSVILCQCDWVAALMGACVVVW